MRREHRWQRSADTHTEDLGEECVVWEAGAGTLHHLDAPGALVWRCLDSPGTADEVAARVVARLGDSRPEEADILQDVRDFLADLDQRSLTVKRR
jgi:ABC-type Zn2+ transport system substrate-binding protein/surface adhesin